MKTFFVKKDFDVEVLKGPAGIFQVISILDDQGNDLSGKIGSGLFFETDEKLIRYLRENAEVDGSEEIRIVEDN